MPLELTSDFELSVDGFDASRRYHLFELSSLRQARAQEDSFCE